MLPDLPMPAKILIADSVLMITPTVLIKPLQLATSSRSRSRAGPSGLSHGATVRHRDFLMLCEDTLTSLLQVFLQASHIPDIAFVYRVQYVAEDRNQANDPIEDGPQ